MANHKSALKRIKQNNIRRLRNKANKTRIKNVSKAVIKAVENGDSGLETKLNLAKSTIDKAAKKGVIHKRAASRKISRLSRRVNNISA